MSVWRYLVNWKRLNEKVLCKVKEVKLLQLVRLDQPMTTAKHFRLGRYESQANFVLWYSYSVFLPFNVGFMQQILRSFHQPWFEAKFGSRQENVTRRHRSLATGLQEARQNMFINKFSCKDHTRRKKNKCSDFLIRCIFTTTGALTLHRTDLQYKQTKK